MAERYTKIADYRPSEQSIRCPVQILKGAILWDSLRRATVLQIKFRNITPQPIRSLYLKLFLFDHEGKAVEAGLENDEAAYIDVDAQKGMVFGDNIPIVIPSDTVRSFRAYVSRIIWSDSRVQDIARDSYCSYDDQEEIPLEPKRAFFYRSACQLQEAPVYLPREVENGWQCTCGQVNTGDRCACCGAHRELLFRYLQADQLDAYIAAIAAKERKARQRARMACIAGGLAVLLVVGLLAAAALRPKIEEHNLQRQEEMESKQREDLLEELVSLDDAAFQAEFESVALDYLSNRMAGEPDYIERYSKQLETADELMFESLGAVPCGNQIAVGDDRYAVVDTLTLIRAVFDVDPEAFDTEHTLPKKLDYSYLLYVKHSGEEYIIPYIPSDSDSYFGYTYRYIAGIDNNTLFLRNEYLGDIGFDTYDLSTCQFSTLQFDTHTVYDTYYPASRYPEDGVYTRENITALVSDGCVYFLLFSNFDNPTPDGRRYYEVKAYQISDGTFFDVGYEFHFSD